MPWRPLRARLTGVDEELFEEVPPHLKVSLRRWVHKTVDGAAGSTSSLEDVLVMVRVDLETFAGTLLRDIVTRYAERGDDQLLAVIDALLSAVVSPRSLDAERLDRLPLLGNSVWARDAEGTGLTRRLDANATAELDAAIAPQDAAARELAEARRVAFGPAPNASDAWDHSIKAVEHVLQPIVSPHNPKATLGAMAAELRSHPSRYRFVLRGRDGDAGVSGLLSVLALLWPNPDRHGGEHYRVPTLGEAQAVVHLAVTVVQWLRPPDAALERNDDVS